MATRKKPVRPALAAGGGLLVIIVTAAVLSALAHSAQSGNIAIGHIWANPSQGPAGQTAFYMRNMPAGNTIDVFGPLLNGGDTPDAVTSITSPAALAVNIVAWFQGNQMTHDLPIALPPGKPVAFNPQTQFLRFYGVKQSYKTGDKFPVTFHFQQAPEITIDAYVETR
jgi:copper(I)-binding protein